MESVISFGNDFKGEPFFETMEIELTGLTPGLRQVIDDLLANSDEIPFRKKGTGYQLRFTGDINNPRFY